MQSGAHSMGSAATCQYNQSINQFTFLVLRTHQGSQQTITGKTTITYTRHSMYHSLHSCCSMHVLMCIRHGDVCKSAWSGSDTPVKGKVQMAHVHHIRLQIAVSFLRESALNGQLASMQRHHLMQHQRKCTSKKAGATCHSFTLKISASVSHALVALISPDHNCNTGRPEE